MAEPESAHGELTPVDQQYDAKRFLTMLVVTLVLAIALIFTIASIKFMDFSWTPFAHDFAKHTLETSTF